MYCVSCGSAFAQDSQQSNQCFAGSAMYTVMVCMLKLFSVVSSKQFGCFGEPGFGHNSLLFDCLICSVLQKNIVLLL